MKRIVGSFISGVFISMLLLYPLTLFAASPRLQMHTSKCCYVVEQEANGKYHWKWDRAAWCKQNADFSTHTFHVRQYCGS